MSPRSTTKPPTPAAEAIASGLATQLGQHLREERARKRWTARELGRRARLSPASIVNVEAGRRASLQTYARIAVALGVTLELSAASGRRRTLQGSDIVHAAMGEVEVGWLDRHGYRLAIDHPYQHYQFAGRADVLAWNERPAALLHIENRTRFPDLQQAAGSFNAKRQYLAATLARTLDIAGFEAETHVMVGLWSAEVLHSLRLRRATFRTLCPDPPEQLHAWLAGAPPSSGRHSLMVLLDPFASGRRAPILGLEGALAGARPRLRGYADAAERLSRQRRF